MSEDLAALLAHLPSVYWHNRIGKDFKIRGTILSHHSDFKFAADTKVCVSTRGGGCR